LRNRHPVILLSSMLVLLPVIMVSIPIVFVEFPEVKETKASATNDRSIMIHVQLDNHQTIDVLLEDYVRGVVAAEMPVDFEREALQAQAIAARTYIYSMVKDGEATVTNTVKHQAYVTDEQLKKRWGSAYEKNRAKVQEAVILTRGKIITYQQKPIYAAFFSTSNGRTENSEDYFQQEYPYLRSVDSSWDKQSPKYSRDRTMITSEIVTALEKHTGKKVATSAFANGKAIRILARTQGGRIAKIQIGDQEFTGREVREALQLASSDFSWKQQGNGITFTTYGYGHGVGMSQWGANLLAQQGKTTEEIIHHYYQKVEIDSIK
jgi:stage II sporulation protein D